MRLTATETTAIISTIHSQLDGQTAELKLYGSRVDDSQKGGDLDLLLILDIDKTSKQLLDLKINILIALKDALGEQKIDLSLINKSQLKTEPFYRYILENSVLLNKY